MRLSTKSRFAVIAMIDVAMREKYGPVPLSEVALRNKISLSYLEQMFSKMRQKGLLNSARGPGGGYVLGRQMDDITVEDIICAVEDEPQKKKHQDAALGHDLAHDLWDAMNAKLLDFMQSVTLSSLVLGQLAKGVRIEQKSASNRRVFKKPVRQPSHTNVSNSAFALG
jgi:Rrf2 family iron-sulfur cluster assembly transcriptional regulator